MDRWIVAMGGGDFLTDPSGSLLRERYVVALARTATPRVLFVPTAGGENATWTLRFYRTAAALGLPAADLSLFERTVDDLDAWVLHHDVVCVGGGSTANLLAIWRTHGLDRVMRRAWEEGIVLCGVSAGMNCWFEGSVTDSFNVSRLAALPDGLGLLPGSACPHYDAEPERRPTYRRLITTGELMAGHAADNEAALVFRGTELHEVVTSTADARGYRVGTADGELVETPLPTRVLSA